MSSEIFEVNNNDVYGRYMVAARNIKEGELILKESPIVIGSQIDASHICFRCCENLKTSVRICKNCGIATLCSSDCQGENHREVECTALRSSGIKAINIISNPQVLMPLRCLMLKNYDLNLWKQFMMLESHLNKRKDTPIWKTYKVYVEEPLRGLNLLTKQDLDEEIVQKICGILDVNSFEVRQPETYENSRDCLRGLYLQASLMTHDCIGNTLLSVDDDFVMTVHASKSISIGETIFFNYSNSLKGTFDRRQHLQEGKYFECDCRRCSDPSELGTHISSIKCNKCNSGLVIPTIPLSDIYKTSWICQHCSTVYKGALIKTTIDEAKGKIACFDPTNIAESENLLKKLEILLSPQHYLVLEVKQNLIPLYEHNLFSDWAMQRKIQLCKDVIDVLRVIEPGISRLQGIALYRLHSTQLSLANKLYQCKEIIASKYLEMLLEAEDNLTVAVQYLLYEPKRSPEGRLTQHAINDLKILRNVVKQIKMICESKLTQESDILYSLTHKNKIK